MREASCVERRDERVAIGVASSAAIEPLEPPGGAEQQRRGVARAPLHHRHSAPQRVDTRSLELVEGAALRLGSQPQRILCGSREILRICRQAGALGATRGIERQVRRALEKCSRRSLATTPFRRSADRSSSSATASSGAAAASARCHARRSGSASPSVTSAIAACARRRSSTGNAVYAAARTSGCLNRTR